MTSEAKQKLILPYIVLLLVALQASPAHAIDFKKYTRPIRVAWQKLCGTYLSPHYDPQVAAFSPSKLAGAKVAVLSEWHNVYRVTVPNVGDYVLRASDWLADPAFESFAAEFMLTAPGLKTSPIRSLSQQESAAVLDVLKKNHPHIYHALVNNRTQIDQLPLSTLRFSIGRFHEGFKVGRSYFAEQGQAYLFAEALALLSEGAPRSFDMFVEEWRQLASSGHQQAVLDDLKLASNVPADLKPEALPRFISENMSRIGDLNLGRLYYNYLNRIPKPILVQLADHWAITFVLGISDFHNENWGLVDSNVVAVDLALKSEAFTKGLTTDLSFAQPFGDWRMSGLAHQVLLEHLSEPMKAYLRGLNKSKVRDIAAEVQFEITDVQVSGILHRAQKLLKSE
jgi:hypothetical protein